MRPRYSLSSSVFLLALITPPVRPRSWIAPCLEWFRVGDLLRDARERQRFKARLGIA